ncbi:MAG: carboxypeptidase-like regulatory domain-containing protein [Myxococcota bacterium]
MRFRFPPLTAAVLVGLLSGAANAKPEVQVRVRGGSRLEANATANAAGTRISGALRDDAGRPVRGARLRVRWRTAAGPRLLPRPSDCIRDGHNAGANEADEAIAETDGAGRFCLHWPLELSDGHLSVAYEDERGLLDSISRDVELDRRPPLTLAFSPPPNVFAAESGTATVVVEATGPAGSTPSAPVVLTWVRVDKTATELTRGELREAEALRLSFSALAPGAPGAGELVAATEVGGRRIEARAPVALTARVKVESPAQLSTRSDGSAELPVSVISIFGKVPSGSVEAIANGRTIGIAPVVSGQAVLELHAPAQPGNLPVSLRYLSAAPWWLADGERMVALTIPRPSPWRWTPWAVGLLTIGAYLLAGWRRPRRRDLPRSALPDVPQDRASIEWVAPARRGSGWAGRVTDAHDGAPIAGARIVILALDAAVAEVSADAAGEFSFSLPPEIEAESARIRIDSTWHSALEKPLPPPGKLAISLLTRRRALLATLVEWAQRQGRPFALEREPTPGEVGEAADEGAQPAVAAWARRVEDAAFGPAPVDADREAGVREQEPKH